MLQDLLDYLWDYFFNQPYSRLTGVVPRSGKWPALERKFLTGKPNCEVCGCKAEVVHYIIPFHKDKSKELDLENLASVCNSHCCHLMVGHLGDFHSYNPEFRRDAQRMLSRIMSRPQ